MAHVFQDRDQLKEEMERELSNLVEEKNAEIEQLKQQVS